MAVPHVGGHRDILIDGFVPPSTSVAPMFPFYENSSEWDDFGEVINPEDYVIKDEDMDQATMQVSFYYWTVTSLLQYLWSLDQLAFLLSVLCSLSSPLHFPFFFPSSLFLFFTYFIFYFVSFGTWKCTLV